MKPSRPCSMRCATNWASPAPRKAAAPAIAAPAASFVGDLAGDGELSDLQWVSLDNPARLPMVDVTELMLRELAQQLSGAPHQPALLSYSGDKPRLRRFS